MPNPTTAAEWAREVCVENWPNSWTGDDVRTLEEALDAYARQRVEAYSLTVDDPASMHLHYDGCPFAPYAHTPHADIPDPRPDCTCAEAHKGAYWKGQWMLERTAKELEIRQRVEAFRERAAGLVETYKLMTPNRKSTGLRISLAAALRALEP